MVCSRCSQEKPSSEESIDPLGHQWERQVKKEPTCTEPGTASMVCSRCGQEKPGSEESIEPFGHQWERKVKEEPTCTEPGTASMVCSRCGQEKPGSEESIDPLGHQWERKVKEKPTTTKPGVSIMACSRCKLEKPNSEEQITVVPQKWIKGSDVPASFTSDTAYTDFLHVKIDDIEVDQSHYDVTKDGTSTIVTFKTEFLETLSVGKHMVEITSSTGSTFGMLEIKAKTEQETLPSDTLPKTGEISGHYSWLALLLLSAGGLIFLARNKKRILKQKD
jgi:LPXTG-motif cell wall-anchored protein